MSKVLRKITASIAAAVLCSLPVANSLTANATANSNARFTYRKNFAVSISQTQAIDHISVSLACRSANTSAPVVYKLNHTGTLYQGGSGAPGVYNGGGSFYPTDPNMKGGMVSISVYCNSPSDYKELSYTSYAYDANNNLLGDIVGAGPTFLVGDLNLDKKVDDKDYQILHRGLLDQTNNFQNKVEFSYFGMVNVAIGGVGKYYSPYSFDINNDGYLSKADDDMFMRYLSGTLTRFAK